MFSSTYGSNRANSETVREHASITPTVEIHDKKSYEKTSRLSIFDPLDAEIEQFRPENRIPRPKLYTQTAQT